MMLPLKAFILTYVPIPMVEFYFLLEIYFFSEGSWFLIHYITDRSRSHYKNRMQSDQTQQRLIPQV